MRPKQAKSIKMPLLVRVIYDQMSYENGPLRCQRIVLVRMGVKWERGSELSQSIVKLTFSFTDKQDKSIT